MENELNELISRVDELYGPRIVSQLDAEVSASPLPALLSQDGIGLVGQPADPSHM